ncbi:MAG: LPS export ABC transporter periplasmic protein LptC [Phaeodactylibacter sp.]|nr:LPS export ABC transporter periplasmic protein LptC [Phaeodactylibacter sp.]MCB9273004.1 LPS export ABC transporter periplasmic protein LptC [Lewinellaceae bacterium]
MANYKKLFAACSIHPVRRPCFAGIICLAFILAGGALLSGCKNDMEDISELVSKFDTQAETAKNVEILYSDSAQVRVRVTGPTMLYYLDRQEPRQEFPDGVHVEFFGPAGSITSELTARYGIRMERQNQVVVRDSVVWHSVEGEKLESEELIWDERSRKVYTQKFVVVTRPGEIIYGHGFEADQDFSYSRINAIEGRLKTDRLDKELE